MIKLQNISKKFGTTFSLSDINLEISTGKVIALVGENGAGKSTLMRIMCGYLAPTTGNVLISGYDIEKERIQALSNIGYVPEISALYKDMIVYDFLEWIARIWHVQDIKNTIFKVAETMQISDILIKRIDTLSKGYKKRVEIAAAILHEPKFLILDEPTDGLDPNQKRYIRKFIKQYAKNNAVFLSTHILEDADIADRIIMLSSGKIIKDATIKEFKKISPKNSLENAFYLLSNSEEIIL